CFLFFSSRRRHTRFSRDWSSDVCSSDLSLVERAQEQYDEEEARKIQKKIAKNEFGFDDFLSQIQQVKKMGSMKDLVGMIPGVGKALKDVEIEDDAFKHIEA